jgi:predicted transcriptional regulator
LDGYDIARSAEVGINMANGWHRLLRRAQRYEELPLAALQAIAELRPQLAALEQAAIKVAREKGATWEEIATALGVTRQAAQMRFRADSQ